MKRITTIGIAILLSMMAMATGAQAQQCGYYAIGGCFTSSFNADQRSSRIGGRVIDTDNYSNFTPGYFCVVNGPYRNERRANGSAMDFRAAGVSDAYVKRTC